MPLGNYAPVRPRWQVAGTPQDRNQIPDAAYDTEFTGSGCAGSGPRCLCRCRCALIRPASFRIVLALTPPKKSLL